MDQPVRFPWDDFPDVLIHAPELFVKRHASYAQAKAGDAVAAAHLVMDSLADDVTNRLSLDFNKYSPVLLPVLAEESAGLNPIPRVMAEVLAHVFKWDVEKRVLQTNVVGHTGAGGFVRLANQGAVSWRRPIWPTLCVDRRLYRTRWYASQSARPYSRARKRCRGRLRADWKTAFGEACANSQPA